MNLKWNKAWVLFWGILVLGAGSAKSAQAGKLSCEGARMLWLINEYRGSQRVPLPALKVSIALTRASQWHAEDMAKRNYFDHNSPGGLAGRAGQDCSRIPADQPGIDKANLQALEREMEKVVEGVTEGGVPIEERESWQPRTPFERMSDFGYAYRTARGENIAAGHAGAIETFCQWKNSPGHNKNMLSPKFLAIGIGNAKKAGTVYGSYWNTDLGGFVDATLEEPLTEEPGCRLPVALPSC